MDESWTVGVDLGGTKLKVARVNSLGEIGDVRALPTNTLGGPEAVEADIVTAIGDIKNNAATRPEGVGIGVAGQIDHEKGSVLFAPNLGWHEVSLRVDLEAALGMPVVVTNDVRAITWGEWIHGAGKGYKDVICLYVGTGVGGGLIVGGKSVPGSTNTAGELGHLTVVMDGPSCTCGNRGCLEAIAGGWAIARRAREMADRSPEGAKTLLRLAQGKPDLLTAEIVAKAAHAGDELSMLIFDEVARALIAGCVSLVNALNPRRLILGGGVIDGVPELIDRIGQGVKERALPAACRSLEIVPGLLGNDAGVIGAAAFAVQEGSDRQNV
jgi:glucokinase